MQANALLELGQYDEVFNIFKNNEETIKSFKTINEMIKRKADFLLEEQYIKGRVYIRKNDSLGLGTG